MVLLGEEIGEQLSINEIADAYSKAVPPRIVAERLKVKDDDAVSIEAERVLFKKFILDTYEKESLEFPSQTVAWEAYTWDLEEWVKKDDFAIDAGGFQLPLTWEQDLYDALNSQINPSNYDEFGGQQ